MTERVETIQFPYLGIYTQCFAITSDRGTIFIDSGIDGSKTSLLPYLSQNMAVLCTHGHWDHIGNHRTLQESGATVYAHTGDARYFADADWQWNVLFEQFSKDFSLPSERASVFFRGIGKPFKPDLWILGDMTLDLFGSTIRIYHTPGHSNGSVSYSFEDEGWLFTGDTLMGNGFFSGVPQITDPEAYRLSMEKLLTIRVERVYCDHNEAMQRARFKQKVQESIDCLDRMAMIAEERVRRGCCGAAQLVGDVAETICRQEGKSVGGGACITALSIIRSMAGRFELAAECSARYEEF